MQVKEAWELLPIDYCAKESGNTEWASCSAHPSKRSPFHADIFAFTSE